MGRSTRRRKVRSNVCRALHKCIVCFAIICVFPIVIVFIVTSDNYSRFQQRHTIINAQFQPPPRITNAVYNLSTVASRLEERRQYLRKMCMRLGLDIYANDSLHRPNPWEFLVNFKHHLIWCNVFKAASSSWMYNFNILAGYSKNYLRKSKKVPLALARHRYPRPSLKVLMKAFNNSVSFLIVRHPFERLLSAYKDKILYAIPQSYHRKLGYEIVARFRKQRTDDRANTASGTVANTRWPTFPEFVSYVIDCVKTGTPIDMHWTPIAEFCTPCQFNFDVIAHTETLHEDQDFLIRLAKLEGIIQPQWQNAGKNGNTAKQAASYYAQLKRSQIIQLYHIYQYDFLLFNYTMKGYLEVGIPDDDPSDLLDAINEKGFPRSG